MKHTLWYCFFCFFGCGEIYVIPGSRPRWTNTSDIHNPMFSWVRWTRRAAVLGKLRELVIQHVQRPVFDFAEELTTVSIDFCVRSQRAAWAHAALRSSRSWLDWFHCNVQLVAVTWLKPDLAFLSCTQKSQLNVTEKASSGEMINSWLVGRERLRLGFKGRWEDKGVGVVGGVCTPNRLGWQWWPGLRPGNTSSRLGSESFQPTPNIKSTIRTSSYRGNQ